MRLLCVCLCKDRDVLRFSSDEAGANLPDTYSAWREEVKPSLARRAGGSPAHSGALGVSNADLRLTSCTSGCLDNGYETKLLPRFCCILALPVQSGRSRRMTGWRRATPVRHHGRPVVAAGGLRAKRISCPRDGSMSGLSAGSSTLSTWTASALVKLYWSASGPTT
jgi:hypothetical protein